MNEIDKWALILVAFVVIATITTISFIGIKFLDGDIIGAKYDDEYSEYIAIRDYSNCTKENDPNCTSRSRCIHAYRQCQINQCGSEGIGW